MGDASVLQSRLHYTALHAVGNGIAQLHYNAMALHWSGPLSARTNGKVLHINLEPAVNRPCMLLQQMTLRNSEWRQQPYWFWYWYWIGNPRATHKQHG